MDLNVLASPMPTRRQQSLQYLKQRAMYVSIRVLIDRVKPNVGNWTWALVIVQLLCGHDSTRGELVVFFLEYCTHTRNGLHDELSPLAHLPTRKEKTKKNVVIVKELRSIVEDGPCQKISKTLRRDGKNVVDRESKHQVFNPRRVESSRVLDACHRLGGSMLTGKEKRGEREETAACSCRRAGEKRRGAGELWVFFSRDEM